MGIDEDIAKRLGADLTKGITSEYIQKHVVPPMGIEYVYPVFFKYGRTMAGICDGWTWYEYKLRDAPQEDLWQMMAIASKYWESKYKEWYERKED